MKQTILFLFLMHVTSLYSAQFRSLWLDSPRSSWPQLQSDLECDVAIVGGGISGVATLYFLLTSTEKKVALFEKSFIASGATGHNAGIAIPCIERSFSELIKEFGYEPAKQLCEEITSGVELLYTISAKVGFEKELFPLAESYFGHSSVSTLIDWLEEGVFYPESNSACWVLDEEEIRAQIPVDFYSKITWASRKEISNLIKREDPTCVGISFGRKKCIRMNSALFCQQVLQYLVKTFPNRCRIYENNEILHIDLKPDEQCLHHAFGKVLSKDLILCTNGYKNLSIFDMRTGKAVSKLANLILPKEGFMAAYPTKEDRSSAMIGFILEESVHPVPYWYLSVAPFFQDTKDGMVCLGGPEYAFNSALTSEQIDEQAKESLKLMREWVSDTSVSFPYFWHGTMAYTQNGMRWVGEDPNHPHLWYNLGCNGVGIISALVGGEKIAKQMCGETFGSSLFDPPKDE